jgi:hypothetical protein
MPKDPDLIADINDAISGLTLLRDFALAEDWAYPTMVYSVDSEELVVRDIYDAVPTAFHGKLAELGWLPDRKNNGFRYMILTTATLDR